MKRSGLVLNCFPLLVTIITRSPGLSCCCFCGSVWWINLWRRCQIQQRAIQGLKCNRVVTSARSSNTLEAFLTKGSNINSRPGIPGGTTPPLIVQGRVCGNPYSSTVTLFSSLSVPSRLHLPSPSPCLPPVPRPRPAFPVNRLVGSS